MTIENYVIDKLQAFHITEAHITDLCFEVGIDPSEDYTQENMATVGKGMCRLIEELALAPHQRSVNENGFSESWDMEKLGKYYLWLCRKWGVKPSTDTLASLDISTIIDRTSIW